MSTEGEQEEELVREGSIHELAEQHATNRLEDEIQIDVSFRIIKQFSLELYDNPRRAIEELVCNSYDAGANICQVTTPEDENDDLKVLDDGESMGLNELDWLWTVAESPKVQKLDEGRVKHGRKQIGKFGVGKLAAFALGNRLTHIATKDGKTRVVSVHQDELKTDSDLDSRDDDRERFTHTIDVQEFSSDEAREVFEDRLDNLTSPWEKGWDTWTLAVIEDIPPSNTGNDLQPWHLNRMLPAAVPSEANFTIELNGETLTPKESPAELAFEIQITSDDFKDRIETKLKTFWATEKNIEPGEVDEELYTVERTTFENPGDTDEEIAGLDIPNLGHFGGDVKFYESKYTTSRREERNYTDHGYRIYTRGRLVNKNDIQFGLANLSHRYLIRLRADIEIPSLDQDLRVTRDSTQDTLSTRIAKLAVRETFNAARSEADRRGMFEGGDEEPFETTLRQPFSERLKLRSPWYGPASINGLTMDSEVEVDIEDVNINVKSLRSTDKAVEFSEEDAEFVINESHPLFDTLNNETQFTEHLKDAFSEILAGRLLLHGYLRHQGADKDALAATRQIFDAVLRSAADDIGEDELSYQLGELEDASFEGHDRFEQAIVDIFQNIGLSTIHEGGPDTHDAIIEIPRTAQPNYKVSVEAKGRSGVADHSDIRFDNVNRHRVERDCDQAIVVARDFQVDGRGDKRSALIRNADEEINEGAVENISFMRTDALKVFLALHYRQPFTYEETIRILENNKNPNELAEYVVEVWEEKPDDQISRRILEVLHEFSVSNPTNPPEIGTITSNEKTEDIPREVVIQKLEALDRLCDSVKFDKENKTVDILGSPEIILDEVDEFDANAEDVLEDEDMLNIVETAEA